MLKRQRGVVALFDSKRIQTIMRRVFEVRLYCFNNARLNRLDASLASREMSSPVCNQKILLDNNLYWHKVLQKRVENISLQRHKTKKNKNENKKPKEKTTKQT